MTPILSFDIETIPDVAGIRLLEQLPSDLSDQEVAEFAFQQQRAKTGTEFLPLHLHKVVAISVCLRWGNNQIKIGTIGDTDCHEAQMIQQFYDLIEKYTPQLVSWNGGGFDLPVLHYRALIHGITADRYWETGKGNARDSNDFKWNNYTNRYHTRHCDIMDTLSMFQARAFAPLDDIAKLCGFAGKLGMDGSQVWQTYSERQIQKIRDYCETDTANTYLMYLRYQLMTGAISQTTYQQEIQLFKNWLQQQNQAHWQEFLQAWQ